MKKSLLIASLLAIVLSGCEKKESVDTYAGPQSAPVAAMSVIDLGKIVYKNNSDVQVRRIQTPDGVDCIITNRADSAAISCNFPQAAPRATVEVPQQ